MEIRFTKPGIYTTVQDLGRFGYLSQGVPQSGAMDQAAMQLANLALANQRNDAVLEITYAQAAFDVLSDLMIAYAGYGGTLMLKDKPLPTNRAILLKKGMHLHFRPSHQGCRIYLAACGGWDVPAVMGSRSTYLPGKFGGLSGRLLQADDRLSARHGRSAIQDRLLLDLVTNKRLYSSWSVPASTPAPRSEQVIRIVRGPEAGWFADHDWKQWLNTAYTLDRKSNRMGYTLVGKSISATNPSAQMLSSAVCPGSIQITGDGTPILLMADCQTTGGYPRIAQVAAVDLPLAAQLKPSDRIYFQEIAVAEAERLFIKQEETYEQLAQSIAYKYL